MPARKKARKEPIDGELVIVPPDPSPADALPPEMPAYDAAPDTVEPPPPDAKPPGGWRCLPLGAQPNTETLRELHESFPPSRLVAMMEAMATATTETKSGRVIADWRAREQVIKIMLSYSLGLPVPQVQEPPPPPRETNEQTLDRLMASPAARRMLLEAIQKAEAETVVITAEK